MLLFLTVSLTSKENMIRIFAGGSSHTKSNDKRVFQFSLWNQGNLIVNQIYHRSSIAISRRCQSRYLDKISKTLGRSFQTNFGALEEDINWGWVNVFACFCLCDKNLLKPIKRQEKNLWIVKMSLFNNFFVNPFCHSEAPV